MLARIARIYRVTNRFANGDNSRGANMLTSRFPSWDIGSDVAVKPLEMLVGVTRVLAG